ncbi:50S ribosomal protein L2 [Candidatus Roizmanbacteria bacterium RIFCSPHIGHO2_12_FULL_44_10]|uniref:Large ribosomal subunit protein uL2 n=1 Tax=Candidatus Roizmanbacteria bacterium RIFCSPHIGHO2_12_FULL_44_10 TaxID=1802054 RepID=A0A1F7I8E6_9BACT|nr:MAG: 50S ribosomal protein L2 [Candidatus Roizmanbacteria bacterium RIFCSPHIGHO2_12_FULL_44_10]
MPFLSNTRPEKNLTRILKKRSGRDNTGQISVRHQGGRQKRYYRLIDFKRDKVGMKAVVVNVQYDPNRTANIALVKYEDGEKRYILHPEGLKVGDSIISGESKNIKPGNALKLEDMPLGTEIHNIELYPGKGGQIVKSAGSSAVVIAKEAGYADIKLPSKEVRKVLLSCYATIGRISNIEHKLRKIGKAGRTRLMGIRPTVRGVAQNPRSHPHGGGEGRSSEGMHPKTPWGKSARGTKTRQNRRNDRLIVKSRKS